MLLRDDIDQLLTTWGTPRLTAAHAAAGAQIKKSGLTPDSISKRNMEGRRLDVLRFASCLRFVLVCFPLVVSVSVLVVSVSVCFACRIESVVGSIGNCALVNVNGLSRKATRMCLVVHLMYEGLQLRRRMHGAR